MKFIGKAPSQGDDIVTKAYVDSRSLPSQVGNAGKFLTSDGVAASWSSVKVSRPSVCCFTPVPVPVPLPLKAPAPLGIYCSANKECAAEISYINQTMVLPASSTRKCVRVINIQQNSSIRLSLQHPKGQNDPSAIILGPFEEQVIHGGSRIYAMAVLLGPDENPKPFTPKIVYQQN